MNQKYDMDIKDFLLVEILLCILLIVLTKGIFEVKLSKLQFAITQTENAAKYLSFTKEDFVRRNAFFSKRFAFMSAKASPKKSSLPSDLDKTVPRSALSNVSSTLFNPKTIPEHKSPSSFLHSSASDSGGSNANICENSSTKRSIETETKRAVQSPKQEVSKQIPVSIPGSKNKSPGVCLAKEKVNSSGTFLAKSSGEQQSPAAFKTSKSAAQGLNGSADGRHIPGPSSKSTTVNVVKSFSQGLTPPGNSSRLTPVKSHRGAVRGMTPDKTFKSKSQDLWAPHLKR